MKNGPYELVIAPPEYPGKRYRDRYVYEHQLVWWQSTGQLVPDDCLVHHKNEQKRDNRIDNLELKNRAAHSSEHALERQPTRMTTYICGNCTKEVTVTSRLLKQRLRKAKCGLVFCSISCSSTKMGELGLITGRKKK